jgi:cytochrome c oxidase assembly factor CtaG
MNICFLLWHLPPAYELTLRSEPWHNFEHLCFLFTSIAFWWNVLAPWPYQRQWPVWAMVPYLFTADLINTMLSAVLAFSGRVFYPSYAAAERICRLSPLQDQIAAGAEMWVLNSIVFLIPAIFLTINALSPKHLRQ